MKSSRLLSAILAFAMAAGSGAAQADVGCTFNVSAISITPEGWLNVVLAETTSGAAPWWYLCNTGGSTTVNNGFGSVVVTSDNCKAILSQLLTARSAARPISMWFKGPNTCTAAALPAAGGFPTPYPANITY